MATVTASLFKSGLYQTDGIGSIAHSSRQGLHPDDRQTKLTVALAIRFTFIEETLAQSRAGTTDSVGLEGAFEVAATVSWDISYNRGELETRSEHSMVQA